jgi:predicted transcriptional regulator
VATKLLLTEPQEAILQMIKHNPGISQSQIAANVGMSRKVVNYHIKILRDAGLIFVDTHGRETECFYAAEV